MYSHRNLPQMVSFESSPPQKLIAGGEKYQTRAVIHLIIQNRITCANKKELIIQNICKKILSETGVAPKALCGLGWDRKSLG